MIVSNAIQLDQFGNGSVDSHGSTINHTTAKNGNLVDFLALNAK